MEIAAGLRDPHLTRSKFIRLVERLGAVTAAEGLTGDVALLERRASLVQLLGRLAKVFPEGPPPPPPELSPEEQERESARIIEELVARFSAGAPADPGYVTAGWPAA
ncbi:MAG: hypothetical protein K0S06_4012 [Microvirga sp.]|jgi:hypothetical protein|nr:hypothetical protein [Microvirga sp.]